MTDRIEASKLARGLGAVLERVVAGETLEIVRYGRVVAVIGPPKVKRDPIAPDVKKAVGGPRRQPLDAVSPQAMPKTGVGKVSSAAERQRHVDELLRGARRSD